LARTKRVVVYFNDTDALDVCEYILVKKKIVKNNYIKNDKIQPFYVIIETPIESKTLIKILDKVIKNQYIMR